MKKKIVVVPAKADAEVKYASANSVRRMFDLPRCMLYELEGEGVIESISLKKPGTRRGKRLWHVGSIEKYLEDQRRKGKREAGIVMEVVEARQVKKASAAN